MKNESVKASVTRTTIFAALLMIICNYAIAIGIVVPIPIPRVVDPAPPVLQSVDVSAEIIGNIARTRITQIFHNPNSRPVEADFIFPVPDGADITDFVLYMNGKPVKGEILAKDKAQEIYRDIVRKLRDPGLVEWSAKNLFRVRVFPIPARGDQKLEIELSQPLTADQGYYRYKLPLKSTSQQAASGPLPKVLIKLVIEGESAVRNIYSPTHKIDTSTSDAKRVTVVLNDDPPDHQKDFLLYYESSGKDIAISLLTHRTTGTEGYFSLRISPPWDDKLTSPTAAQPGDYVFVIDSSGSMAEGDKIEQARKALRYCVGVLAPDDRFNVIRFSTAVEPFRPELLPASSENRKAAVEWINALQARGGTNISEALKMAVEQRKNSTSNFSTELKPESNTQATSPTIPNSMFTVVFITDGLPTVGQTIPEEIIKTVAEKSGGNVRIFTFGVGNDVNTRLLDSIADSTRAASDYVAPDADLEVPVSRFFDKVSRPALFNLQLTIPDAGATEIYPAQLPDLFYGTELAVFGKYKSPGTSPIVLSGAIHGKKQEYKFEKTFPDVADQNPFIEKLWATRKVAWLLDEVRKVGESGELRKEIEELAHKYSIVTPYTSFLSIDDQAYGTQPTRDNVWYDSKRTNGSVVPGASAASPRLLAGRAVPGEEASNFKAESGAGAVQAAQQIQKMKTADVVTAAGSASTDTDQKIIGAKTFKNVNGVWKDTAVSDTEPTTIKILYLSEAWFHVSENYPKIRDCLSVGEQVKLLLSENIVLEIGSQGLDTIDDATKKLLDSTIMETK